MNIELTNFTPYACEERERMIHVKAPLIGPQAKQMRSLGILQHILVSLVLSTLISTKNLFGDSESSWKSWLPWPAKKWEKSTETITSQLNHPSCTLVINNTHGSITLKTWDKENATIEIQKSAPDKEALGKIKIEKVEKRDLLSLTTQEGSNQQVDYLVLVPAHAHVQITTQDGDINCSGHFLGKISATVEKGSISMDHHTQLFTASTTKTGGITILQADGPVNASTASGAIAVKNSKNSVLAKTQNGALSIDVHSLPTTSKIDVKTNNGTVTLKLDATVNADIQASTQKGTLISTIPITIKSYTTTLGPDSWKQFKKSVDGTIGSGESLISIACVKGSIKISPLKA